MPLMKKGHSALTVEIEKDKPQCPGDERESRKRGRIGEKPRYHRPDIERSATDRRKNDA